MSKDYTAARNTLARIAAPDAYTYYLAAILAARTNQAAEVATNLAKAVKLDRALLDRALSDAEFVKFASSLAGLR